MRVDLTATLVDLRALPNKQLQRVALQWCERLRRDPKLGKRLEWRRGQDLRECRKIYFDEDDRPLEIDFIPRKRSEEGARFRIVYRLLPDEDHPEVAQVLGIGPKYGPKGGLYAVAAERFRLLREGESP